MNMFEFAQPIQGGIYIAAAVVCALFATLMARSSLPNKLYLLAFLVVKALIVSCEWWLIHLPAPSHFFWLALLILLSFGPAPLLLRFALGVAHHNQQSHYNIKLWEWLIVAAVVALMLPLFLASQVLIRFEVSPDFGRLIHWTMSFCIMLFVVQVAIYWQKAKNIYLLELRRIKANYCDLKQSSLTILKALLYLVMANLLFSLLRTFNVWFWHNQFEITLLAKLCEYSAMLVCLFYMFHRSLPQSVADYPNNATPSTTNQEAAQDQPPPKYAKTQLDQDFRNKVITKLTDTTKVRVLALDSNISLVKLSQAIGEKPYYVSQVMNQDLGTNFYEFITELRILEVTRRLSEPGVHTIFDIALAAGFNSKSSFNTSFKKHMGMTPSQYRTKNRAEASTSIA